MFFSEIDRVQNLKIMNKLHAEYGRPECVYSNTQNIQNVGKQE